ncbi:MAG: GH2, partial [uncultured Corynebacteriales bacterium]
GTRDRLRPHERSAAPATATGAAPLDRARRDLGVRLRRHRDRPGRRLGGAGRRLRPADPRPVPAGVPGQRDRRPRLPPRGVVPAGVPGAGPARRAAADPLRRGGLPGHGLGQRPARGRPRGRAHPVQRGHHRAAGRGRRPGRRRPGRGPAGGPDPAARQAGLAGAPAQRLVRADHRHLAAGLAGAGPGGPGGDRALDARPRPAGARPGRAGHPGRHRAGAAAAAGPALAARRTAGGDHVRGPRRPAGAGDRPGPRPARPRPAGLPVVPGPPEPDRRDGHPAGRRRRRGHGRELRGPAHRRGVRRTAAAQRPAAVPADGAGAELLAGLAPGGTGPGRAAPGGGAGPGAGVQRRPDPPEGRGPAVPVLVRPAGRRGVDGAAERVRLHPADAGPAGAGVDRGGHPGRRLAGGAGLGAVQRELGAAGAGRGRGAAARGPGALLDDEGAGPDPPGGRQRRLGARGLRHPRHPRLQPVRRDPAGAVRQPRGGRDDPAPGAALLPLAAAAGVHPGRGAADGDRVRRHHLPARLRGLLERLRRGRRPGRAGRPLRRPGHRAAGQPGRRRLLLHPAHRHRAGAQRSALRRPDAEGGPGHDRRGQPPPGHLGAGRRHRRDPDRARRAAALGPAGRSGAGPPHAL